MSEKTTTSNEPNKTLEDHFVLRVPASIADRVREKIRQNNTGAFSLYLKSPKDVVFRFEDQEFPGYFYDLPTIVESLKTYDNKQYYKIADVSQILVLNEDESEKLMTKERNGSNNPNEFEWKHGLTPPLWNARLRRFRKTAARRKQEEVEAEVRRLLAIDQAAEKIQIHLIEEMDDEDDEGSVMNDSRAVEEAYTGTTLQDEANSQSLSPFLETEPVEEVENK